MHHLALIASTPSVITSYLEAQRVSRPIHWHTRFHNPNSLGSPWTREKSRMSEYNFVHCTSTLILLTVCSRLLNVFKAINSRAYSRTLTGVPTRNSRWHFENHMWLTIAEFGGYVLLTIPMKWVNHTWTSKWCFCEFQWWVDIQCA